jgi:hypothetical protein
MLAKRQSLSRGAKNQVWADLEQLYAARHPEIRGTSVSTFSELARLGIWAMQSPQQVIHETLRNSFKASRPWPHHPCLPSEQEKALVARQAAPSLLSRKAGVRPAVAKRAVVVRASAQKHVAEKVGGMLLGEAAWGDAGTS